MSNSFPYLLPTLYASVFEENLKVYVNSQKLWIKKWPFINSNHSLAMPCGTFNCLCVCTGSLCFKYKEKSLV